MTPRLLKNYRTKTHMSQAQFAKLIDVTQGQVNHWESGRQPVSAYMALVIEHATHGELSAVQLRPDLPWPEPAAIRQSAIHDALHS
ncbi:MAG: helix-turn-helix domain-containing protein [Phycisphaerales bacterium]|nr:helix-turn-helix domain-containing protein [Phycisphaerales bacterium]